MGENALPSQTLRGAQSAIFDVARGRLSVVLTVFLCAYVLIGARLVDLSVVQGTLLQIRADDTYSLAGSGSDQSDPKSTVQPNIYDRNGLLLATTMPTRSLYANPRKVVDAEELSAALLRVFPELNSEALSENLSSTKGFTWVKRELTPEQANAVLAIGDPALGFEAEQRRVYPQRALAAHLLGYRNIDETGLAGIERTLKGAQSDRVNLSLDIRLQHILEAELQETIEEFAARAGTGLIMDIRSGEILAGASLPDFDPNHAGAATDAARFNRLSLGVYELGSIFKVFSTAALIDSGAELSRKFDARKPLKHGRHTIRDFHPEKRVMTVPDVFIHSSNIGSAMMGLELGDKDFKSYYKKLGLLSAPEIEITEVGHPLVPQPWRSINTLTASYGHGVAVSALQLAAAVAATVGDGTYITPTILQQSGTDTRLRNKVFSEETALKMRKLMRLAVTDGTGRNGDVPGYQVGGKTGTAEQPGPNGYDSDQLMSSFVSVFPMSEPRYLVLVAIDRPQGHEGTFGYATGGWVAAPTTARIIRRMTQVMGISPQDYDDDAFLADVRRYLPKKEEGRHARATY